MERGGRGERGGREGEGKEERKMGGKLDVRRLDLPTLQGGRGVVVVVVVVVVADGGANTFLSPSLGTSLDA